MTTASTMKVSVGVSLKWVRMARLVDRTAFLCDLLACTCNMCAVNVLFVIRLTAATTRAWRIERLRLSVKRHELLAEPLRRSVSP